MQIEILNHYDPPPPLDHPSLWFSGVFKAQAGAELPPPLERKKKIKPPPWSNSQIP